MNDMTPGRRHVHAGPGADLGQLPPMPVPPDPPPPPEPPPPGGRRPRKALRMRKGDVRTALLGLLDEQPRNGYQLMRAIAERSGGAWKPSPGSIYPTLALLADEGLVTFDGVGQDRRCSLTDQARSIATVERRRLDQIWESLREPAGAQQLRSTYDQLGETVRRLAATAGEDQVTRAAQLLGRMRRELEELLPERG